MNNESEDADGDKGMTDGCLRRGCYETTKPQSDEVTSSRSHDLQSADWIAPHDARLETQILRIIQCVYYKETYSWKLKRNQSNEHGQKTKK